MSDIQRYSFAPSGMGKSVAGGTWVRYEDHEAEVERLRECYFSLAQLVALKDGPRDATYYSERESAWAGARKALAEYEPPARAALPGEENDRG